MRIIILCPLDPAPFSDQLEFIGGKPTIFAPWVSNTVDILKSQGVEVTVVVFYENLRRDVEIIRDKIRYYFLSGRFLLFRIPFVVRSLLDFTLLRIKLSRLLSKENPDLVHLYGTEHDLAYCYQAFSKIPHLIAMQGFMGDVYKHNPSRYNRIKCRNERKCIEASHNFATQNPKYNHSIYEIQPHAKIFPIDYPIDTELLHFQVQAKKSYEVVFFGRISQDKGVEDLIYCFREVLIKIPKAKMKIIGSCSNQYQAKLTKLITDLSLQNNVELVGLINTRSELFQLISCAKLSVLPTYYDNNPKTVLESIALGVPTIVYSPGMIAGANQDSSFLTEIPTGDTNALSLSIIGILQDDLLYRKLQEDGLNWIAQRFSEKLIASTLIAIYQSIIAEKTVRK